MYGFYIISIDSKFYNRSNFFTRLSQHHPYWDIIILHLEEQIGLPTTKNIIKRGLNLIDNRL